MITTLLEQAIKARQPLMNAPYDSVFRLFNGFTEGCPELVIDMYGSTILFHNYASDPDKGMPLVEEAQEVLLRRLNWLRAGIVKVRNSPSQEERRGTFLFGDTPDQTIKEHGVSYSLHLTMNRDASFFLDTRNLRKWLIDTMRGKTVLNTFAYTGSFGVAALAGKATRVIQVDHSRQFLDEAKKSYKLNGFSVNRNDFLALDFFPAVSRFKQAKQIFDCAILDPPFFSSTSKGRVDQVNESRRLINKVRPLVKDGGHIVAINNALYLSGQNYLQTLENLCRDGYLEIKDFIPVPDDFIGYEKIGTSITDPAPFNHSTKIAILGVKRK